MGCCVSKTKLKRSPSFADHVIQDKRVIISQQQQQPPPLFRTPPIRHSHSSKRVSPVFPLSPSHSSSSFDSLPSFSRRRSGPITTSSSSAVTSGGSSCSSSSVLTAKDRSFSNEFLWSCVRENPHVLFLDSIKESACRIPSPPSPVPKQGKQSTPADDAISRSNSQKRVRSGSPVMARQKSFRRDRMEESVMSSIRSPSPSRRFGNGESWDRGISAVSSKESGSQRVVGVKVNAARSISPYVKREELKSVVPQATAPSPPARGVVMKKNRETLVHRISSKIDELAVAEAMARYEGGECVAMEEDFDNPLISLDCFIFL